MSETATTTTAAQPATQATSVLTDQTTAAAATQQPAATTAAAAVTPSPGTWRETLPTDLANDPGLAKFTDVASLAKSYKELEKSASVPRVQLPNETWGQDQWNEFYSKIGRPAKPEEYGFTKPEKIPEGVTYSEERDKWFAGKAHELGLTKAQAIKLRDEYNNLQAGEAAKYTETAKQSQALNEKAINDLRTEYGPNWNGAVDAAQKAVKAFGGDELANYLKTSGLGNNPLLIKTFAAIGKEFAEHRLIQGIPSSFGGVGPATAHAEIEKMKSDPVAMAILRDQNHPDRPAVYAKWSSLLQKTAVAEK